MDVYQTKNKSEKQKTCSHRYLIGKSNGKFECVDCDKQLDELPNHRGLMF